MSSLPLLNEVGTKSSKMDMTVMMCSPAVFVLVVGSGLVVYSISQGNIRNVGPQMLGTIMFALIVGSLCLVGLPSVSWALVALPAVIVVSLVLIVILTLMLTTPSHPPKPRPYPPRPTPPRPYPPKKPTMSEAYRYVMTGKGFGLTGF